MNFSSQLNSFPTDLSAVPGSRNDGSPNQQPPKEHPSDEVAVPGALDSDACAPLAAPLPRHVVLLTNFIPPYRLPVYRALSQRVEQLTVLVSTPMESNRRWSADWEGLDVRVQRTWTMTRPWKHSAGFSDRLQVHFPLDTLARLRELRPDVVVSAEMGLRSLQAAWYCRNWGVPWILWATVSEATEQGRGTARQLLRRWLLRRPERVIVNGESGARYVQRFGVDAARIDRVPYTAATGDFERIALRRSPEQAHDLLFVGQWIERKGLLPFLHVLREWGETHRDRRLRLRIAGEGPLRGALEDFAWPPNIRAQLLGHQSYAELARTYAQSGILVFPTLADEWGLVVNEAMAAGVPVLGSLAAQSVEELCEPGKTGWSFDPGDPRDMARALETALKTPPDALDRMRQAARERVRRLTAEWAAERLAASIRAACATAGKLPHKASRTIH